MVFRMIHIMQSLLQLVMKKVNKVIIKQSFVRTDYLIKDMDHAIIMQKLTIWTRLEQQKSSLVLINPNLFHQNDLHHQQ